MEPVASINNTSSLQQALAALKDDDNWGVEAARLILDFAHKSGYSDLHLSSHRSEVLIRARRDAELIPLASARNPRRDLLIARLKVLARVPSFVRHKPQDGRIDWQPEPARAAVVLRIAFLPALHGECVVIRFPERKTFEARMDRLGMRDETLSHINNLLAQSEGALIVTGPSGSGKTTTMYALLRQLHETNGLHLHLVTIENPVEQDLEFATQVQVNEGQGLTFDRALRAALRHDPNVLLIGEIRDLETARIAIQAGMTGHLVFSSLHAGRAALVYSRLLSLGVEPYLVASAVNGALAQRLVKLVCKECNGPARNGAPPCAACGGSGTKGRTGIFEFLSANEELRELVLARAGASQIMAIAAARMGHDLEHEARRLVTEGRITEAEYRRHFGCLEERE